MSEDARKLVEALARSPALDDPKWAELRDYAQRRLYGDLFIRCLALIPHPVEVRV